ncbi:hypothetical protein [Streptomyces poriferorum]|uniref:MerR family transcriptional regulator n=1 Tax=Streptomyces poriferorum TaxID=2798799 RepID=A0ABY9J3C9_9ACTN|nr:MULTISPECIES: hypothetical protein [unclassified Streptomyces]MDP5310410.1 hypothetical protein [Streptomyces sp. Alt4]WLQ60436.1 hypothetical protein P8A19_35655 [Streptomyces sp. Alt2]
MSAHDTDPTRREELLFILLHGGARTELVAQRVVDLAVAEALAEQEADIAKLRARLAELESATGTARAMHRKHPDSEHCQYDDMTWPCPTVTALGGAL